MPRPYYFRQGDLWNAPIGPIDYTDLPPAASGVAPGPAYPTAQPIPPSGDVYGNVARYNDPSVYVPRATAAPPVSSPTYYAPPSYQDLYGAPPVTVSPPSSQPSSPNTQTIENQPLPAMQKLLFGNQQQPQYPTPGFGSGPGAPDWAESAARNQPGIADRVFAALQGSFPMGTYLGSYGSGTGFGQGIGSFGVDQYGNYGQTPVYAGIAGGSGEGLGATMYRAGIQQ